MNSGRRIFENRNAVFCCLGWSRHCAVHAFILTISTSIFATCMILSVYLTYKGSMDKIVVVLIVGSCLLYLLSFFGHMYSIYHNKQNNIQPENDQNSFRVDQSTGVSAQSSSTNEQPPDITYIPKTRELFGKTPPPPYEVQMSEMTRMLRPGSSRTTESSTRNSEIAEEARKLIKRMYEEFKKADQMVSRSPERNQPLPLMVQIPLSPVRQHSRLSPKTLHQNLVVQRQQIPVQSIASSGLPPADCRTNPMIQKKLALKSLSNPLDMERSFTGNKRCIANPPQQLSPRQDLLRVPSKRKLISPTKHLQMRSQNERNDVDVVSDNLSSQNKTYEEIEVVNDIQNNDLFQSAHYSLERELENPSAASAASELEPAEHNIKFRNPSMRLRCQLSASSTKKFRQLEQSPETVLDAIATCFDLSPDEWMVAWKLSQNGVSPSERARILNVRLHGDPYDDDN